MSTAKVGDVDDVDSSGTEPGRQPRHVTVTQQRRRVDVSASAAHTHPFNGPLSGTIRVSRYQKGKTNLDFTEARDSKWQWHQQVCTSLQTDNHASNPPLSFLQAGCPSCRPTNSVKALKAASTAANQIPDFNFTTSNYGTK